MWMEAPLIAWPTACMPTLGAIRTTSLPSFEDDEVFGEETKDERFCERYATILTSLHEIGSAKTVEKLIADEF